MAVEWFNQDALKLVGMVAPPVGAVAAALIRSQRRDSLAGRLRKTILEAEKGPVRG